MPPKRKTLNRTLTTAEHMLVALGLDPVALVRSGLSPKRVQYVEREWDAWNAEHGFAWRVAAGFPTVTDQARLKAGDLPGGTAPPPPGLAQQHA